MSQIEIRLALNSLVTPHKISQIFRQIADFTCMSTEFPELAQASVKSSLFGISYKELNSYNNFLSGALMLMQSKYVENSDVKLHGP